MAEESESHLRLERRAKIDRLRAKGVEPYPWQFPGRTAISEVLAACGSLASGAADESKTFRVAGRVGAVRSHGRSSFVDLNDLSGHLQLFVRVDDLGEGPYDEWMATIDPGDLVGADGVAMVTRRGEPSLRVKELVLLAKAIAPPPEKYHGLKDPDERIRRRYVDLLSSPESRARFRARSLLVWEVRRFLDGERFLEVETPVLTNVASGAAAQPFRTRSNYLDQDLQLRIALELPLKRLLVGGLERVYEIAHVFRNEDMDSTHSPEFTMLELYWAYHDYVSMQGLVERMYSTVAQRVPELLPDLPVAKEVAASFTPPFDRIDFVEALEERSGIAEILSKNRDELRSLARGIGATVPDGSPEGVFLDKLFTHYVEPTLQRPTFVLDHPVATTPLAKRHRSKPGRVERFEFYCRGVELGNAYTELNDPVEQAQRFQEQLAQKGVDHYAYDADFVEALEFGMPPATGIGIGIDRMVMALTGASSIKDVILFVPTRDRADGTRRPGPAAAP
jgi:lysyl-tRNA synthetase class 2